MVAKFYPGIPTYDLYHANFCEIWQSDFEQTNRLFGLVSMILTRKVYLLTLRENQLNSICGMTANQMIHTEKMLLILSMQIVDGPMVMGPCKRDSGMIKTSVTDFMSHVFSTHPKVSFKFSIGIARTRLFLISRQTDFAETSDFWHKITHFLRSILYSCHLQRRRKSLYTSGHKCRSAQLGWCRN